MLMCISRMFMAVYVKAVYQFMLWLCISRMLIKKRRTSALVRHSGKSSQTGAKVTTFEGFTRYIGALVLRSKTIFMLQLKRPN